MHQSTRKGVKGSACRLGNLCSELQDGVPSGGRGTMPRGKEVYIAEGGGGWRSLGGKIGLPRCPFESSEGEKIIRDDR